MGGYKGKKVGHKDILPLCSSCRISLPVRVDGIIGMKVNGGYLVPTSRDESILNVNQAPVEICLKNGVPQDHPITDVSARFHGQASHASRNKVSGHRRIN